MSTITSESGKSGYVDGDYFQIKPEQIRGETVGLNVTPDQQTVEVIHPQELQAAIRAIPALSGAVVSVKSEIAPWYMHVGGAVAIYGQVHFWETEIDARGFKSADDIMDFAGLILKSIEKAATTVGQPG